MARLTLNFKVTVHFEMIIILLKIDHIHKIFKLPLKENSVKLYSIWSRAFNNLPKIKGNVLLHPRQNLLQNRNRTTG